MNTYKRHSWEQITSFWKQPLTNQSENILDYLLINAWRNSSHREMNVFGEILFNNVLKGFLNYLKFTFIPWLQFDIEPYSKFIISVFSFRDSCFVIDIKKSISWLEIQLNCQQNVNENLFDIAEEKREESSMQKIVQWEISSNQWCMHDWSITHRRSSSWCCTPQQQRVCCAGGEEAKKMFLRNIAQWSRSDIDMKKVLLLK